MDKPELHKNGKIGFPKHQLLRLIANEGLLLNVQTRRAEQSLRATLAKVLVGMGYMHGELFHKELRAIGETESYSIPGMKNQLCIE